MAIKMSWKAVICASAVMTVSSAISIGCTFYLLLAKATDAESAQRLLNEPFFQTDLLLEGGIVGISGLVLGYIIGPVLAGYLLGHLAQQNSKLQVLVFAAVIMLLWATGIIAAPAARGAINAGLIYIIGGILIVGGGFFGMNKWRRNGSNTETPARGG